MRPPKSSLPRLALAALAIAGCQPGATAPDDREVAPPAAPTAGAPPGGERATSGWDGFASADASDAAATPACVRTVHVASDSTLAAALEGAHAGDCIELADGRYTVATPLVAQGSAAKPIVVRALARGKATISGGNLVLDGAAYVTVEGLDWTSSGNIRFNDCDHCRLTRTRIHPTAEVANRDWVALSGSTRYARIDHDELGPKNVISNMVMLSGAGSQVVQYTRIDHNYFHDVHRTSGNGWETIRAGLSGLALSSGYTIIEFNLFDSCDGDPETISIKQSDAIVRYNTLRTTAGEITLRLGNRTQVYGNYLLGGGAADTGGIRVCGSDHVIYDNYIADVTGSPGILLEGGESDGSDAGTSHYRVHRAQVVFNTIVGSRGIANGSSGRAFEPVDGVIANNLVQGPSGGTFTISGATNTRYQGNMAHPTGGSAIGMTAAAAQIRSVDPKLAAAGELLRPVAGSPAVDAAMGSYPWVSDDIDGRPRVKPDVGASELSTAAATRHPLTAADVGVDAP